MKYYGRKERGKESGGESGDIKMGKAEKGEKDIKNK